VRAGLERLWKGGCPFVIVLGHPEYYPRFGFVFASLRGLCCQWEGVPDEAVMVLVLREELPDDVDSVVRYRQESDRAVQARSLSLTVPQKNTEARLLTGLSFQEECSTDASSVA
jgi:hypothetical protein